MTDMSVYLQATAFIDSDHPSVLAWAASLTEDTQDPRERAVRLFEAVREMRYDPYTFRIDEQHLKASETLAAGRSYCVRKAILLAAGARALGIPSRLGFADVRNHLATRRLLEWLRSDLFVMHGYTELWIDGRWVKATPTFDSVLCRYFHVPPLAFDGREDAIFHAFTHDGDRHMEYVHDHGHFADMPYGYLMGKMQQHYPHLFQQAAPLPSGDFQQEALAETQAGDPV